MSTALQRRCDEHDVEVDVSFAGDLDEEGMAIAALDHGYDFVWLESRNELEVASISECKYMINLHCKGDHAAFMLLKKLEPTVYETKYDCVATRYLGNVGRILFDVAAEVAFFDAARVSGMPPREYTAEKAAEWIVRRHLANAGRIGEVTIVSPTENKLSDEKNASMRAVLEASGYRNKRRRFKLNGDHDSELYVQHEVVAQMRRMRREAAAGDGQMRVSAHYRGW
jgi:hypothetical protein